LQQADAGVPSAEVCRKSDISAAAFHDWRKKYGGLMPSEMRRLKQLEEENNNLKRIVADLSLDKALLQSEPMARASNIDPPWSTQRCLLRT
jgi:putative transposase